MVELTNDQVFASYKADDWWKHRTKQVFEIAGRAGVGKASIVDAKVPTPLGFKRFGNLKVGDYVFDRCGLPTRVLGVYPQGKKRAYKITFEDGRSNICCKDHLWTIKTPKGKVKTVPLEWFFDKDLFVDGNTCKYSIPICGMVEYDELPFDTDPYVIGAFIGNGCNTSTRLTFSSNDEETVALIASILGATGYKKDSNESYSWTFEMSDEEKQKYIEWAKINSKNIPSSNIKLFQTKYVFRSNPELMVYSHEKRIPRKFFYGSIKQRWSLIQGLFDTDGSISTGYRGNIVYSSKSKGLLEDIREILWSLGCMSTIREQIRTDKNNEIEYSLYAKVDNQIKPNFFRLTRKKERAGKVVDRFKNRDYGWLKIHKIEDLGYDAEMQCILVDNPEHLYLSNDYLVTHNTYCIKYILQQLGIPLKKVLFVAFTGKAATVLARNGLPAMTTCAAFYEFIPEICRDENNRMIILPNGKPKTRMVKRKLSHLKKNYDCIVIDEASMIAESEREDIESFGLPIFALGDLNQLPPVFGKPAFMENPDVVLRQIMRQAEDDPIVWIANRIIDGESLSCGVYGNSCIKKRSDLTEVDFKQADMIITGTNKLRHAINQMFREQFKQIVRLEYPHIGEKILCVHNDWSRSIGDYIYLTNGLTGFIDYVERESFNGKRIKLDFRPDFTNKIFRNLVVDYNRLMRTEQFLQTENNSFLSPDMEAFEFGYAVTCHKAQGSGWEKVLGLAEMFSTDLDYLRKYLYTMVTRASFGITLAIERDKIYLS